MKNEPSENRFGLMAIKLGFISVEQLVDALGIQTREELENGERRLIGWILLEQGHMTVPQVNEVLKAIGVSVLETLEDET